MNNLIPPWTLDSIATAWDTHSTPLKLRSFNHGKSGSRSRSQQRLTRILLDNAHLLGHHRDDDLEDIAASFETTLVITLRRMQSIGLDAINQHLNTQYTLTLGFWQFTRPDISNITTIANEALGRTPAVLAQEQDDRAKKAALIKRFKLDCDDFITIALRLSDGDLTKLAAAFHHAAHGFALAEDRLRDNA